VNEIELAHLADEIENIGLGRGGRALYLCQPGTTTKRERDLLELELRRRGLDVQVNEGTINMDVSLQRVR
jgi:hypothetical protein